MTRYNVIIQRCHETGVPTNEFAVQVHDGESMKSAYRYIEIATRVALACGSAVHRDGQANFYTNQNPPLSHVNIAVQKYEG